MILLLTVVLASCVVIENTCPEPPVVVDSQQTYDLISDDALTLIDKKQITGSQVSVDGVAIGDSFQTLLDNNAA